MPMVGRLVIRPRPQFLSWLAGLAGPVVVPPFEVFRSQPCVVDVDALQPGLGREGTLTIEVAAMALQHYVGLAGLPLSILQCIEDRWLPSRWFEAEAESQD